PRTTAARTTKTARCLQRAPVTANPVRRTRLALLSLFTARLLRRALLLRLIGLLQMQFLRAAVSSSNSKTVWTPAKWTRRANTSRLNCGRTWLHRVGCLSPKGERSKATLAASSGDLPEQECSWRSTKLRLVTVGFH